MLDTFADLSPARLVQGLSRCAQRNAGSEPLTIETRWQAHGRSGKYIYISCSIDIFLRHALLTKLKKFSMHKILELSLINPFSFNFLLHYGSLVFDTMSTSKNCSSKHYSFMYAIS